MHAIIGLYQHNLIQILRLSLLRVQNYQNNVWIIRFEINSENGPVDMLKCVSYI